MRCCVHLVHHHRFHWYWKTEISTLLIPHFLHRINTTRAETCWLSSSTSLRKFASALNACSHFRGRRKQFSKVRMLAVGVYDGTMTWWARESRRKSQMWKTEQYNTSSFWSICSNLERGQGRVKRILWGRFLSAKSLFWLLVFFLKDWLSFQFLISISRWSTSTFVCHQSGVCRRWKIGEYFLYELALWNSLASICEYNVHNLYNNKVQKHQHWVPSKRVKFTNGDASSETDRTWHYSCWSSTLVRGLG